ncbi:MAG: hypothetical protein ETSY1_29605 [Candidatus Entotheonella factor]|uniref:PilZ domain-containing protein n=1 Tax=Entotheonella factor TaxID=1429438 RepID=W4LD81_ENTF1|nr:MAG: hypothetical protein ETSY1_29605 [Candidatus Entotheonella factor]
MRKTVPIDLSREHTNMMIELRNLLRPYGVKVSLTDRHAALELINASIDIEDEHIQNIRSRIVALLPESQYCYLNGEPYEQVICEQCGSILQLVSLKPKEQYVGCSCGQILLFIIKDQRTHIRHAVKLLGLYRSEGGNSRIGEMMVEDLSYDGARIRSLTPHNVSPDERLIISFTLDDAAQTNIHKTVTVVHVHGDTMGVHFVESSTLDYSLANYLGINWLRL